MENLNSVLTRMQEMLDAYENRCAAAFDRMDVLNSTLRQEQDAMAAAAAADDMNAYREHEASMRFTTARIEAARQEQVAPLFSGFEEARALAKEYSDAAAAPIYARMLELINEQEELAKALEQLSNDGYACRNDQRYTGGVDNPDIAAKIDPVAVHVEVKRQERPALPATLRQAKRDANGHALPVVVHRSNRQPWLMTVGLEMLLKVLGYERPCGCSPDG